MDSLDADDFENLWDHLHGHVAIEEYGPFPAAAQKLTDERCESIEGAEPVSTG